MTASWLPFLLPLSLGFTVPGTAPLPRVSEIHFEDLALHGSHCDHVGEPRFKRSAALAAFARETASCVAAQRETWLNASVSDTLDGSIPWDLEVTWDRQARLVVHAPAGKRMERFLLDSSRAVQLNHLIERARYEGAPEVVGVGQPLRGVRTLSVLDAKELMSIRILALDKDWMYEEANQGAILALEVWSVLRNSFEEPACSDHQSEDEVWLPSQR